MAHSAFRAMSVEEAADSGISDILIITDRGKRAIEDYFDDAPRTPWQASAGSTTPGVREHR